MIVIEHDSGLFRACVEDVDAGVAVALWHRRSSTPGAVWRPLDTGVIDVPFHVACDVATPVVRTLTDHSHNMARGTLQKLLDLKLKGILPCPATASTGQ